MEMRDDGTLVDGLQMEEELCRKEPQKEESLLELLGMRDRSDESLPVMRALAQKGDRSAILWMGAYYMQGEAQERDIAEACYWLNKSRDTAARARMAQIYEQDGNTELAVKYYTEAVECLSGDAQEAEECFSLVRKSLIPEKLKSHILATANAPKQLYSGESCGADESGMGSDSRQGKSGIAGNAAGQPSMANGKEPAPQKKGFWNRFFGK